MVRRPGENQTYSHLCIILMEFLEVRQNDDVSGVSLAPVSRHDVMLGARLSPRHYEIPTTFLLKARRDP